VRINIIKCDQCQKDIKEREYPSFFGVPTGDEICIALKAGSNQGSAYRDFCSEECLRDYLVAHIKPKVEEKTA